MTRKVLLGFIIVLMLAVVAQAVPLTWDAPTTNTDGSPLTDLAGYKIYCGTVTKVYSQPVVTLTLAQSGCTGTPVSCTYNDLLQDGTWFCAATAYDTAGNESVKSNEVSKTVVTTPVSPGNMR